MYAYIFIYILSNGESVIDSLIAGFHGDSHYGYENVLADIIRKLPEVKKTEGEKIENLVNIFGILPQKDIYFKGDLEEIKRILEGIGLKVNTFFGYTDGVQELVQAPGAALNLVFLKWGIKAAKELERLYGIQSLVYTSVPTGIREVREFVNELTEKLSLDEERAQDFQQQEEENFRYYFRGIAESFFQEHIEKKVAIVGDEGNVIRYASYLKEYLGAIVETAVVTDFFPSEEFTQSAKTE